MMTIPHDKNAGYDGNDTTIEEKVFRPFTKVKSKENSDQFEGSGSPHRSIKSYDVERENNHSNTYMIIKIGYVGFRNPNWKVLYTALY